MAKKDPVPEIVKTARDGSEATLLEMLADSATSEQNPKALAAVFFCVAGRGLLDALTELLRRGVDAGTTNGHVSGLGMASKYGKCQAVKMLLAHGAAVDVRTDVGQTPLMLACKEKSNRPFALAEYNAVVADLLAAGAEVNAEDEFQETALLFACDGSRREFHDDLTIPRLLMSHGADLTHVGILSTSALSQAAVSGNLPLAKLLIERGHPLDVGGGVHYTPLMMAARHRHTAVVQLLLQHKADPTLAARDGTTALLVACEENRVDIVKALIAAGVDWRTSTARGTALEVARARRTLDVVKYLESIT